MTGAIVNFDQSVWGAVAAGRPHPFAAERAGFIGCKVSRSRDGVLILAHTYLSLQDYWYSDDDRYGCFFNADAMRAALQFALTTDASMFHVHMHEHLGTPWFSRTDLRESSKFVSRLLDISTKLASWNSGAERRFSSRTLLVSRRGKTNQNLTHHRCRIPNEVSWGAHVKDRFSRQSYLGNHSEALFQSV